MATELHGTALQGTEAQGITEAEATHPGMVISPLVDIFETASAITVLADMPGVDADHLKVDLNEGVLTITGRVVPTESSDEVNVLSEYRRGTFQRKFTLSESIDQDRIQAGLTDGVLRLELPKVERAKQRRIEVRAG
jgi:HSP20 family protein